MKRKEVLWGREEGGVNLTTGKGGVGIRGTDITGRGEVRSVGEEEKRSFSRRGKDWGGWAGARGLDLRES